MTNTNYISDRVDDMVRRYDTRDPFALCRAMHIRVRYKDLGNDIKAFFFYQSRIKNVVINERAGNVARRVLCAHELGHAVLHGELAAMRGFQELELFDALVPTEYEANLFAAELLIEDSVLLSMLKDRDASFFDIAKELYVPSALLDFKFRALKSKGYSFEPPCHSRADFLKDDLFDCEHEE